MALLSSAAKRYALIKDGKVFQIGLLEPDADVSPIIKVEIGDDSIVTIDDEYDGTQFTTQKGASASPSTDELWEDLRASRNAYLSQTDWTQVPDVPDATKTKWQSWRQELRDLPANTADPSNVTWPTKPT